MVELDHIRCFATSSLDQTIIVWDDFYLRPRKRLELGQIGSIHSFAYSPAHHFLFTAGFSEKVFVWHLETKHDMLVVGHLEGHAATVTAVEVIKFSN